MYRESPDNTDFGESKIWISGGKECLNAFRLRGRHGLFPFTSGLPRVKGKNNSQRVTKAHLDSPRVTSGEATSDEWGIEMGLE